MGNHRITDTTSRLEARTKSFESRGLSFDFLKTEYLDKNRTLQSVAEELEVGVKLIRNALAHYGIVKPKANWQTTAFQEMDRGPESNWAKAFTPEIIEKAQAMSVASRAKNTNAKLAAKGITRESLKRLYLDENRSLRELVEHFNSTEKQVRNWLKRFDLVKTQELRDQAQKRGIKELFEDPIRSQAFVNSTQTTTRERYGNRWYRVTASKEETSLADALAELFPDVTMARSDYSVIHKGGTGGALQLDIYLPELKLAIEYNGEYWHDRAAYEADLINSTKLTRESLKDELCAAKGLKLLHVWSGDWKREPEVVLQVLANEILGRMSSGDDLSDE